MSQALPLSLDHRLDRQHLVLVRLDERQPGKLVRLLLGIVRQRVPDPAKPGHDSLADRQVPVAGSDQDRGKVTFAEPTH